MNRKNKGNKETRISLAEFLIGIPEIQEEIQKQEVELRNTNLPKYLDIVFQRFKEKLLDSLNEYFEQKDLGTTEEGKQNGN